MEAMGRTSTSKESTVKQILDLAAFIASVLARLSFEQVKYLLGNKDTVLRKKLQEVFEIPVETYADVRAEWQRFYRDHFAVTIDFSDVEIPSKPEESSWRLIFIPAGTSLNQTLAVMREKFQVWTYAEDLDKEISTNTRTSAKSYAVWVQTGEEPDSKYLGKSTREADMDGKIGVTLLERLVFEVKFFTEMEKHLDYKGITFCTGSRYSDGRMPDVCFDPGKTQVWVGWFSVDYSDPSHGLREAVSL